MRALELKGLTFGKLTVLRRVGSRKGASLWLCACECGNEVEVIGERLKAGETKSCGHKVRRICSIDGCSRPHFGRGWCSAHWKRWVRHGDPLGGGTGMGEAERHFREVVLTYDGDECLIWPYANCGDGRGVVWYEERVRIVSRVVCEIVNGPAPSPDHHAAHSCGRGNDGCVAARHLSWKSPKENNADKIEHGTAPRGENNHFAKLSEDQVRDIWRMKGAATQQQIADQFGVSRALVSCIHRGKIWQDAIGISREAA